jgi:hypothetical protein
LGYDEYNEKHQLVIDPCNQPDPNNNPGYSEYNETYQVSHDPHYPNTTGDQYANYLPDVDRYPDYQLYYSKDRNSCMYNTENQYRGSRSCDRMVVGLTTTCVINAYCH